MIELVVDGERFAQLKRHLFQSDRDEHAAVILAGVHHLDSDIRLLCRELHLVPESDFGPGTHGHRQTSPRAVAELATRAGAEGLAYVALHSHPGAREHVSLSRPDTSAHARLFPHLADLTGGAPVAGLALGDASAAGEVWLEGGQREQLDRVQVLAAGQRTLTSAPRRPPRADGRYDRQARLFGDAGQDRLSRARVAVIGAGGGGSILAEQLAHLGVGTIMLVDFDTVGPENLSRIVGATAGDARARRKKVDVLAELARRVNPDGHVIALDGDLNDGDIARRVSGCDFIFLATDTISSRLVFNAIVHRYLIPGVQIGAKVEVTSAGDIDQVYVAVRPVWPQTGCLHCNGLISPDALQRENRTAEEARDQNYLGEPEIIDPSVITLNGIAASHATTIFLMSLTGLADEDALRHRLFFPLTGEVLEVTPRKLSGCSFCSPDEQSGYARGGSAEALPVRPAFAGDNVASQDLGFAARWRRVARRLRGSSA